MTCSPNQTDYVRPDKYITLEDTGREVVAELTYFTHKEFNEDTYNSCKNVQFPSMSDTIMGLLCGPWGSMYCTPERWWTYLGTTANGYSPFEIHYDIKNQTKSDDGSFTYHNPAMTACNMPPKVGEVNVGCQCADCEEACTKEDEAVIEPINEEFLIGNANGYVVIAAAAFGLALFLFVAVQLRWVGDILLGGITHFFTWWGVLASKYPKSIISASMVIALGLSCGIVNLEVTTDPIELWASPVSRSRIEKDFFDSEFRPFYRTTQVIIRALENEEEGITKFPYQDIHGNDKIFGPVFQKKFMLKTLELQEKIRNLTFMYEDTQMSLNDVCNKPVGSGCNIQNVWGYWQDDASLFNKVGIYGGGTESERNVTYLDHFVDCTNNPSLPGPSDSLKIPCMAAWGGPVSPYYILGGFIPSNTSGFPEDPQYHESTALVLTIIIDNFDPKSSNDYDVRGIEKAMLWEAEFVRFMKDWEANEMPTEYMEIAFNSERSVEDELNRETYGDLATIAISYILMFIYITLSLGQYQSNDLNGLMIESKITLGLMGVMLVLVSVAASFGIFGMFGVPATLIIFEIIPFLVLAVGVDNIFILVQTHQRSTRKNYETHSEHLGRIVGEVAPSMLLSSVAECTCFFLGALSGMPAVRAFALYAGMALLIDFFMQITCFVSLISLDMIRQENSKYDVFCCIQGSKKKDKRKSNGILYKFIETLYAPFLMTNWVRFITMILFLGLFCLSIVFVPQIEVGLDQEVSMPEDSFVLKYFIFLKDFLSVGPPVYFVVNNTNRGLDFSRLEAQNKLCMGHTRCKKESLGALVRSWSKVPEDSFIASSAFNWVDTYLSWVDDEKCCRYLKNETDPKVPCDTDWSGRFCTSCGLSSEPSESDFKETIPWFLKSAPNDNCPHGGKSAFGDGVQILELQNNDPYINISDQQPKFEVLSSNFMAFHTILKTSKDYYTALRRARELTDEMNYAINNGVPEENHVKIFPYSIFYVFYEQYLTMWEDTMKSVGISLASIFLVTFILMGFDLLSSVIILIVLMSILSNLGAMMYFWHITLNAVSLTNLVMAVGISVEFCSHITRSFALQQGPDKVERAKIALTKMGSSVLSGITLTKFSGILVLAFAKSQIFTIFYFR